MRVVRKGIPLKDGYSKVTGELKFAPDRSVAGGLWMKILRSPHPHAKIKSIDTAEAVAMPGVKAVLTHHEVPQKEILCSIFNFRGRILDDRVRFVGDEVAAVAGETEEVAGRALDLIEVEYEALPSVFDVEEALKPGAPDVRGIGKNKIACPPEPGILPSIQEWGNIEKGFEEADAAVENEVRTQSVYLGFFPPGCIAEWEGDKLILTLSHQCPYDVRKSTAAVLDLAEDQVKVIAPPVAGCFGMLNSIHRFWNIAALLSRKAGRPVVYKMTLEEFAVYKRKESSLMRLRMGMKKDGTVTALHYRQWHDAGGYGWKGTTYQHVHDLFREASVSYEVAGVATNRVNGGCTRGVGSVPQTLSVNQTVDMLAERFGLDPLALWKKNHYRAGDPVHTGGKTDLTLSSEGFDELIEKGSKAIEWEKKWVGWGKPYETIDSRKRGVGMAVGNHTSGVPALPASAIVEIHQDGTALLSIGSMDLGQGCKTTLSQICAEILGFRIEDISVIRDVDTETVPLMCGAIASTSLFLGGSAVKIATAEAKRQLLQIACSVPWSPLKGIQGPEALEVEDSQVYVKADPAMRVSVKDIVGPNIAPLVIGKAAHHGISLSGSTAYITLVGFADVEVDTRTGRVQVLKLVAGHDSGTIINEEVCENQVRGGAIQSLAYGLMEEVAFDPRTGKVLNPSLSNYWVPTSLDVPPVEVIFSQNVDPLGPLGAKGIGESSAVCPHAAIVSAIYNAIGVRIKELPITPDRVLRALGKIEQPSVTHYQR